MSCCRAVLAEVKVEMCVRLLPLHSNHGEGVVLCSSSNSTCSCGQQALDRQLVPR
jgi:hypothetical protein